MSKILLTWVSINLTKNTLNFMLFNGIKIKLLFTSMILCFCLFYCKKETKLGEKHNFNNLQAEKLYKKADSLYYKGSFEAAIKSYHIALKAFDNLKDTLGVTKSLNDIGLCYYRKGVMDSARFFYQKTILLDSIQHDTLRLIGRLRNIGLTYYKEANYIKSINYYKQSLQLAKQLGRKKSIAAIFNSLGNVYQDQGRFHVAKESFKHSLNIYTKLNKPSKEALLYNNLGVVEGKLKNYDSALKFHFLALKMKVELGSNKDNLAFSFHNIGVLYKYQKNYELSEDYLKKAYTVREELNESRNLAATSNALAGLYLDKKEANIALPYLVKTRNFIAESTDHKIKRGNLEKWSRYYYQKSKFQQAYNLLKEWTILNDSLFNTEKLEVLQTWNEFELQEKEKEKQEQIVKTESYKTIAKSRLIILFSVLAITFLIIIFTWLLVIQRKKILKLNQSLELLNTDIRHRKSNDYQRILLELKKLDVESTSTLENMLFSSVALDDVLYEDSTEDVNLKIYLNKILNEKQHALSLKEKGASIQYEIASKKIKQNIASKLAFIISELITNSVKHALKNENHLLQIGLEIKIIDFNIIVTYSDNGKGVTKHQLDVSTGLGWKIIRGYMKQLNTDISINKHKELNIFKIIINLKENK